MAGIESRAQMFDVVPATLQATAGTFDAESDALTEATMALRRHLETLGGSWGDDAVGRRFGQQYVPAAATIDANLGALATGLLRISSALSATASAYERVEGGLVITTLDPPPTTAGSTPDPGRN